MILQRIGLVVVAVLGAFAMLSFVAFVEARDVVADALIWLILGALAVTTLCFSSLLLRGPLWRRGLFMILNTAFAIAISGLLLGFGSPDMFVFALYAFVVFAEIVAHNPLCIPIWIGCAAITLALGEKPLIARRD